MDNSQVVALARADLEEILRGSKEEFQDDEFWPGEVIGEEEQQQQPQSQQGHGMQAGDEEGRGFTAAPGIVSVARRARLLQPLTFLLLAICAFTLQATGAEAAFKANDWVAYKPGGKTMCSHGDPYTFFARAGNSSGSPLVVEFEGGGCCFDALTCASPSYTRSVSTWAETEYLKYRGGIGSATNPLNPVIGWNHLYVPYCTADAHLGNNTPSYGVHHVGQENVLAALQWALANVTNPPTVFVTGGSAGSVGSYMWAPHIFKMYPNARHVHLGDSYAPLFGKKGYNLGFGNWRARTLYYQSGIPGLDTGDWHEYIAAENLNATANAFPNAIFSSYDSLNDPVQKTFYDLEGCGAEGCDWTKAMRKAIQVAHTAPNFASFTSGDWMHVVTETD